MYKFNKPYQIAVNPVLVHGVRVKRVYECNQSDFALNSSGFIRNDFSTLVETEDRYMMSVVLSRMQELSNEKDNSNKSFEELVRAIRPRWCQSPAEMDRFEQYCIDNALEFYKKLKADTPDDVKEAVGASVAKQDVSSGTSVEA